MKVPAWRLVRIAVLVDMLMYYDARPGGFNGMFDYYTFRPIKGYYPIKMFSELYKLGTQIECKNEMKDIYALGAVNDEGTAAFMITRYEDNDDITEEKTVKIQIPKLKNKELSCFMVNKELNEEINPVKTDENGCAEILMQPNSIVLLKTEKAGTEID